MSDMEFLDLLFSIYSIVVVFSTAVCIGWHAPFGLAQIGIWIFNKIAALLRKPKP